MQILPLLRPRTSLPTAKASFVSLPRISALQASSGKRLYLQHANACILPPGHAMGVLSMMLLFWEIAPLVTHAAPAERLATSWSFFDMCSSGSSHKKALTTVRGD